MQKKSYEIAGIVNIGHLTVIFAGYVFSLPLAEHKHTVTGWRYLEQTILNG